MVDVRNNEETERERERKGKIDEERMTTIARSCLVFNVFFLSLSLCRSLVEREKEGEANDLLFDVGVRDLCMLRISSLYRDRCMDINNESNKKKQTEHKRMRFDLLKYIEKKQCYISFLSFIHSSLSLSNTR